MSDDYVYVIPEEPGSVPDEARRQSAVTFFESIAPGADKIEASISEHLEFIHCGANFEKILCPSCGALIELEAWQEWMNHDFQGKDKGFVLSQRVLQCCGVSASLHTLKYEWPQGFARFKICAKNPNIGKLSRDNCRRFEQLLGAGVRIIYEHF
jgi:hypothetical protein